MKLSCGDTFLFRGVELKSALHELLSQNTAKLETRGQLLEMAREGQSETATQAKAAGEEQWTLKQGSPPVIEIHDSTPEPEEETRPGVGGMEDKAFISSLHSYMKDKGSPIERIPHLGFKQINLWRIYKAVEKRGGYELVTAQRLWKKVYDELGGSPGSTSAATCTRRHYERLVLPFERHLKGEEDKPLPLSKPRKPYKRNLDGKVKKAEVKKKRAQLDREMDAEMLSQSPEAVCQSDAVMHPHPSLWSATSDTQYPDCSQTNGASADRCPSVCALVPVSTSAPWTSHNPPAAGEVISPLEKKKRMAQASLNFPSSSQSEDKERPSVIRCSQSPARASSSQNCSSSDGSPLPLSSSSSRSPSPLSVSSEDGSVRSEDKPASSSELRQHFSASAETTSISGEDSNSVVCSQRLKDSVGPINKDISQAASESLVADSVRKHMKDSAWERVHRGAGKYITPPFQPASISSFTKVIPKSVQLLRPAPIRPSYKIHQNRLAPQVDPVTHAKKLNYVAPWFYQTEKREKSRTMAQKVPPAQQGLTHSASSLPVLCVLSNYDKPGRDSRHLSPLHPVFLPNRTRLPQSQIMYHHIPLGPSPSALSGSALYPYPYSMPVLHPQTGYALPAMNPTYQYKL